MEPIRNADDLAHGLNRLLAIDPRLVDLAREVGRDGAALPLRLSTPDFAGLASIIVSQQVSRASASAIQARLEALVRPLDAPTLLACDEAVFREAGLSRPKQRALLAAAEAVSCGGLDLGATSRMPAEQAMAAMLAVKGIGPWTAEVFLLFCGGHPDIFPAGDLALQEAVRAAFGHEARPSERQLREIASGWAPWRGVAARLFWAYYRIIKGGRDAMPLG